MHGGEEHRQLKFSQLKRTDNAYVCTENSSKNCCGAVAQIRMDNKVVPSFAVGEAGERCHVHILDIYFKKVIAKGNFYLRPLSKVPNDLNAPWFTCAPMEKNTLQSLVE